MNTQPKSKGWQGIDFLLPVIIAFIFFIFTFSYYPFREKLQFDTDEGLNLMRSMLIVEGYPLYDEISSDQPPLFNQILALVFQVTGYSVNSARILVLLFSALLVWSGAQFLQLTSGKLASIFFLPLVIMVPRYLVLSVSVMIGLPAIALSMVSLLFTVLWHVKKNNIWLVLSGLTLTLSVLIKLFTGFLAPITLGGIFLSIYLEKKRGAFSWQALRPILIWGISFATFGILLGLVLIRPHNIWSIVFPPLAAPAQDMFQAEYFAMNTHLQAAIPFIVLGALGAAISIYKRNWLAIYPLVWAILAYTLFSFYSPVFYHHQLLVTIPMALMAAIGLGEGLISLFKIRRLNALVHFQHLLAIGSLIGFVLTTLYYLPALDRELMDKPRISDFSLKATAGKLQILDMMNEYADQTNWVVTDMPMYAFRVHKPVPPDLATFSQKRLVTGSLTEDDILTAMQQYHPEQVLMARFEIPSLEEYLKENYTLILSREFFRLFIRNDLKPVTR